jgi:xanthine dehydrogenase accessory factor
MPRARPAAQAEEELAAGGAPYVEATVVRAQRPTSVRPGDAATVHPDGTIAGFVGGACAEASVRLHALRVLETGEPLLLRILPGDWEGQVAGDEGAVTVKNPCLSGGALEIFLEPHLPPPTLRIIGESPFARALADLGERAGFAVEATPKGGEPRPDDAALVVATHGHEEQPALTAALREGIPYVGLVASDRRGEAVRDSLDLPDEVRDRLHTPAGLAIGAQTPEETALAILAEIVALRRSGDGRVPLAPVAAAVAIDPVCGMEVAVSDASIQLELDGERHYFCSEGCRDSFVAALTSDAGAR